MKILVVGSTGGSGRAAVESLLERGHEITAFSRRADSVETQSERLRFVNGDVMDGGEVARAVAGHDAVIVTLGITENPLRVRFFGPARTALDVRSAGTRHVIAAMASGGVRRLVVQTSYGVGETRDRLGFADKLFFTLLLAPQIADTELQERAVIESELDWTIVQPVHLTDGEEAPIFTSTAGETSGHMQISRRSVGRFLAEAVESPAFLHRSVALSGLKSAA